VKRKAAVLVLVLCGVASQAASGAVNARLRGTFEMTGTISFAENVFGEHRGETVVRSWRFRPWCASGPCRAVTLYRKRSDQGILNVVILRRRAPGVYVGEGRFWVALRCAGQVVLHGGLARERITVRVIRAQMIGNRRYATALRANYVNPSRTNLSRCPGAIGHDAAKYDGQLTSSLP
jgi:hypothetical protein